MHCPKCQSPVSADWALCPKCGTLLNQPLPMGIAVTEVKRPSRWQYFLGIAIIVLTTVIAIGLLISNMVNLITPDMRVTAPGTSQVKLDKSYYLLFCEEEVSSSGSCDNISDMDIKLYDSASNAVELDYPSREINYDLNGKSYSAIFEVWIDAPGTYTLEAKYDTGKSGPNATIAIGGFDFMSAFIASFAIGTLGFIIGIVIVIRVAMKRRSVGKMTGVTPIDKFWA